MCVLSVLKTSPSFLDWPLLKWIYIFNFVKSFLQQSLLVCGHRETPCESCENFLVSQEDNLIKASFFIYFCVWWVCFSLSPSLTSFLCTFFSLGIRIVSQRLWVNKVIKRHCTSQRSIYISKSLQNLSQNTLWWEWEY